MNDNHDASCRKIKEAVCIDTPRVYDSCADKDCLADMRVYFTDCGQNVIDNASNVRCRGCEVLNVFTEVERVPFNRGFYSVDLTFFFAVTLDAFSSANCPPETVVGLTVFSKKCILYGSDGNVKIFSSEFSENETDEQLPMTSSNPRAKVQVAEPICLDAKLCRPCDCCNNIVDMSCGIPRSVRRRFNGQFGMQSDDKAVRVTIGVFTIIQLERDVQMLIPAYDFCMPCKECSCDTEDPCDSFRKIKFPVGEFFPPSEKNIPDSGKLCSESFSNNSGSCGCCK
ncbi:MAG: hypothetical protein LUG85_06635 [Clostridiales bacterium]|nr:hypothetical protein [Clostridiales bacterium]